MFVILAAVAALQAPVSTPPAAAPPPAARSNARRPNEARPVCENRARTGGVLRREICVTPSQAASQQSLAKQHIEAATAGTAHEELPLGGAYRPL